MLNLQNLIKDKMTQDSNEVEKEIINQESSNENTVIEIDYNSFTI